ncbi:hypothetical protein CAPN006_19610 [Capnocytophaga canimorsus]|uniref:exodeoxyribonuclease X C-terminal domain-containing protein n=1 Tax=Capnocytophaga canimorsus TaxID=28188 RepID=UPI001AD1ECA3|nr:hypothetical protein [Capnocytophaga canimorsus]GIM57569.1 hypothetical protein CAPN006_19610 [Capnocytophaga canimorsus]
MNYKVYGVNTPIEFGRYKGKTLLEIARDDKEYLEWLFEEVDNICLDTELFDSDIIQFLPSNIISMLEGRLPFGNECYEEKNYYSDNYNDDYGYCNDDDIWADIAGSDDPEDIDTAYWNID